MRLRALHVPPVWVVSSGNVGISAPEETMDIDKAAMAAEPRGTNASSDAALAARLQGAKTECLEAWLPIETAPKDGSEVFFLVPDDKPQQVVCRWANEWGEHACWRYADDNLCEIAPEGPVGATHWRPIFALPSALAQ